MVASLSKNGYIILAFWWTVQNDRYNKVFNLISYSVLVFGHHFWWPSSIIIMMVCLNRVISVWTLACIPKQRAQISRSSIQMHKERFRTVKGRNLAQNSRLILWLLQEIAVGWDKLVHFCWLYYCCTFFVWRKIKCSLTGFPFGVFPGLIWLKIWVWFFNVWNFCSSNSCKFSPSVSSFVFMRLFHFQQTWIQTKLPN